MGSRVRSLLLLLADGVEKGIVNRSGGVGGRWNNLGGGSGKGVRVDWLRSWCGCLCCGVSEHGLHLGDVLRDEFCRTKERKLKTIVQKIEMLHTRYLDWIKGLRRPLLLSAVRFGIGRPRPRNARLSVASFSTRICEGGTVLAAVFEILEFRLLVALLELIN